MRSRSCSGGATGAGLADSYNSTGGANTIIRNGAGYFTIHLPGLTNSGGQVQVTPYITHFSGNSFVPARCNATDWRADSTGTTIGVACVDKNGAAFDNNFMLAYSYGTTLGAHALGGPNVGAYTYGNQPTRTKPYYAGNHFQYNAFGTGPLPIRRTGTGTYTVSVPGKLTYSSSTALVSAVGPAGTYCNLADFSSGASFNVACFAQGGVPTDSKFDLTVQTTP